MTKLTSSLLAVSAICVPAALQAQAPETPASQVVGRSIKAVAYQVGSGSTVDLVNSGTIPGASGQAKVSFKGGAATVEAQVQGLKPPTQIGAEFLTYVLWAVSPEGRASNLGEVLLDSSGKGKLKATTNLQTFSLFVTAEPYSVVRQPSEVLVLENSIGKGVKGRLVMVDNYHLMRRTQYEKLGNPLALTLDLKNTPLELYEARNAVDIARSRAADKYAPDIYSKADGGLKLAENALARKANKKEIISLARQATQNAEDARALSVYKQDQERIAREREEAAAKAKAEAEAKAAAEAAEAKRKADEEARRQAELAAAREAQMKAEAEARQARMKAEADLAAAKAKSEADALKAKEEAANAEAERARKAAEDLRAQLLQQFNRILETRDSPRGLVITMADVLFDTGKYDLRPATRESLAKVAGIILGHPGLNLQVEGHTDSTGSDEFNQKLSEQRASTVREYFITQGLTPDSITAKGFGKDMPVADNSTPAGRQKNRRVELIVSGEVIGVKIGQ